VDPDETRVSDCLQRQGLYAERFSKQDQRKGKTPDFRVLHANLLAFYCEVKSSPKDGWLDKRIEHASPGEIVGGPRNDPIFNRLTGDIHEVIKQFDAVNPNQEIPNVLVLVNHDDMCGFNDLLAVVTGNFYADDGSIHPIYRQFSDGRIRDEKNRVHLYIWMDDRKSERFLFTRTHEDHHATLCTLFGIESSAIRQIGS
jgi:hypothetical protein